jgi:hypothetical protein
MIKLLICWIGAGERERSEKRHDDDLYEKLFPVASATLEI